MALTAEQGMQLVAAYGKRFGHTAPYEAHLTMTRDEMNAAAQNALDTGKPVPGWAGAPWSSVVKEGPLTEALQSGKAASQPA